MGLSAPTYTFSLKSSLWSNTDNYSKYKKVGAFRKLVFITSSFIPVLSLLPHHTQLHSHFTLSPSFSFCLFAGEGIVTTATCHAKARVSCSLQVRHINSLYFCCTFRKPLNSPQYRNNKYDQDKCKFRLLNCPANLQLKGKKLIIPTACSSAF